MAGARSAPAAPGGTRHVALLRGINVSGRNRLAMADLERIFLDAQARDVRTYIQSGNVVFTTGVSPAQVLDRVADAVERLVGTRVSVLGRSQDELEGVVAGNPFLRHGAEPAHLHVTFLSGPPDTAAVTDLRTRPGDGDGFRVVGREVYLHCPNGYGKTTLTNAFFEKRLALESTTRNWRTVTTLVELARG